MFGMNKSMLNLFLSQSKTHLKANGIKFIAITYNESDNTIITRAFKQDMLIISEPMLEAVRRIDENLYNSIISLNKKETE